MKSETKIQPNETENQNDNFCRFDEGVGLPTFSFRHLDLFSGIGGFALAAKSIWKERYVNAGFCEIDEFCHKVLRKNFGEDIEIYNDIKNLTGDEFGTINLLTAGFPCQPYSKAGKQLAERDERSLWGETFRIIKRVKPRYVVAENVDNIIKHRIIKQIFSDLDSQNYKWQIYTIPAMVVGLPHIRKRVWIVAYNNSDASHNNTGKIQKTAGESQSEEWQKNGEWVRFISRTIHKKPFWDGTISRTCRVANGLSRRMDRDRLRVLGNAIVPQVAAVLLAAIKAIDDKLELKR